MLENMTNASIDEKELGIGLQFSIQVGNGRTIAFTAGFPLDWDLSKINKLVDKLAQVSDRQALRYEIRDRKAAVANMYHQLEVQRAQKDKFEQDCRNQFDGSGRHGDFRMTGSQEKTVTNYNTSIEGLIAAIKKQEDEIRQVEEQCR